MSKLENLFICVTPLQIVIAKRIIEEKQLQHVGFIILFYNDNPKYRFYINNLKTENYFTIEYLVSSQKKFDRLIEIFKLKLFLNQANLSTQNIYLASIDNSLVHTILSKINFQDLFTFDDGLANLNYQGQYYISQENHLQKFLKFIIHINWSMQKIKQVSQCHYTLYSNQKNIISKTKFIQLSSQHKHDPSLPKLRIYIGQPLETIDTYFSRNFMENTLKTIMIDAYFPHPRETIKFENINYIESDRILEDYYIEEIVKYNITLYTFFSTSILNLKQIDVTCDVVVLYDSYLIKKYSHIFNIFKKQNIKLLDIGIYNE